MPGVKLILESLVGKNLNGYKLLVCWFWEQEGHSMGRFVARLREGSIPIVCADLEILEKVKAQLPEKKCKKRALLLLVDVAGNTGFNVSSMFHNGQFCTVHPIPLLTAEKFEGLSKIPGSFEWTPDPKPIDPNQLAFQVVTNG